MSENGLLYFGLNYFNDIIDSPPESITFWLRLTLTGNSIFKHYNWFLKTILPPPCKVGYFHQYFLVWEISSLDLFLLILIYPLSSTFKHLVLLALLSLMATLHFVEDQSMFSKVHGTAYRDIAHKFKIAMSHLQMHNSKPKTLLHGFLR